MTPRPLKLLSSMAAREVLAERPEDVDPLRTVALSGLRGEVAFENVDFAYDPGKPVLNDVTLFAQPGTVTALVGPSGSATGTQLY